MGSVECMTDLCDICGRWLVGSASGLVCPAQDVHYRFKYVEPPVTPEPTDEELEAGESLD